MIKFFNSSGKEAKIIGEKTINQALAEMNTTFEDYIKNLLSDRVPEDSPLLLALLPLIFRINFVIEDLKVIRCDSVEQYSREILRH